MSRPLALVVLLWRFTRAVATSALSTARVVLTDPGAPRRAFARLDYGDLSEAGAVVLAALVTLTPGTSVVDLDPERRQLLLHVLDSADVEATLAELRRQFVRPIAALFGDGS